MTNIDLNEINKQITDRSDVFYWQGDRKITLEVAGAIWSDKHAGIDNDELMLRANKILSDKIVSIDSIDSSFGNVNSVRYATTESGKSIVVRCHPRGVKNGYFFAERGATDATRRIGLPTYETLAVHEIDDPGNVAFQIITKMPGKNMKTYFMENPDSTDRLTIMAGKMMARLHKIPVDGFGPFDNEIAKTGKLTGLHNTFISAIRASLTFNLEQLQCFDVISAKNADGLDRLFSANNHLLCADSAILVHNDFADHNLLTDGADITAILDWDECVGGTAVSDIACWSTFYDQKRTEKFLEGYFSVSDAIPDFQEKFNLLFLRYLIMKMTLRVRRYTWNKNEDFRKKIESGKVEMQELIKYFKL